MTYTGDIYRILSLRKFNRTSTLESDIKGRMCAFSIRFIFQTDDDRLQSTLKLGEKNNGKANSL